VRPWYGVDFDGTLVHYEKWQGATHVGAPVPLMVERVKKWLDEGKDVRIFTARVYPLMTVMPNDNIDQVLSRFEEVTSRHVEATQAVLAIQTWCKEHLEKVLPITCVKDYGLVELWDDRAIQIIKNTGLRADLDEWAGETDEPFIMMGAEVIQSARIAPQKIYLHPFTLANMLSRPDGAHVEIGYGSPDPLDLPQSTVLKMCKLKE